MQATFLFGDNTIAAARNGTGPYRHTFGGPPDRKGTAREDCNGLLVHLLHRFDLDDPAVPIAIPGIRWLPLYYCFDFRTNVLAYRLISDDVLVTYFPEDDPNVAEHEEWPDENYPEQFAPSSIRVAPYSYAPHDLDDAYAWAGVFGIGRLSEADRAAARQRIAEQMDDLGLVVPETDEEYDEALSNPFPQGKPHDLCLNPACPHNKTHGQLVTIALMPAEPVQGIHLFGPWGGGTELIFQMCRLCFTIRVSNQSE